ncbi:hypothetical protein GCM10027431_26250 [Lysobacter rhizosphaerae]
MERSGERQEDFRCMAFTQAWIASPPTTPYEISPVFWYYVAPFAYDKWNILFENQPRPLVYDTKLDALRAAVRAAENNFDDKGQPSGVKVEQDGRWRNALTFGQQEVASIDSSSGDPSSFPRQ